MMIIFSTTVLKKISCFRLGADYFAMEIFSKSFVSIMELASYLPTSASFSKDSALKRKRVSSEYRSLIVVFYVNPRK